MGCNFKWVTGQSHTFCIPPFFARGMADKEVVQVVQELFCLHLHLKFTVYSEVLVKSYRQCWCEVATDTCTNLESSDFAKCAFWSCTQVNHIVFTITCTEQKTLTTFETNSWSNVMMRKAKQDDQENRGHLVWHHFWIKQWKMLELFVCLLKN